MAEVSFHIVFANHDRGGSPLILSVPSSTTVGGLRAAVVGAWPASGYEPAPAPADYGRVRLFILGKPLPPTEDRRPLVEMGLPSLDFATPLHVSLRPAQGAAAGAAAGGAAAARAPAAVPRPPGGAAAAPAPPVPGGSTECCTVA